MRRNILVYDDRKIVPDPIAETIAVQKFSEIRSGGVPLFQRLAEATRHIGFSLEHITSDQDASALAQQLRNFEDSANVVLIGSDFLFKDLDVFRLYLQKIIESDSDVFFRDGVRELPIVKVKVQSAARFLEAKSAFDPRSFDTGNDSLHIPGSDLYWDLNQLADVIEYLQSGFNVRHFNAIKKSKYVIVKTSTDTEKLKAEFTFHSFVPVNLKPYFVTPYDFISENGSASYTMERLNFPDFATQWIHGSLPPEKFSEFIDNLDHFLSLRPSLADAEKAQRAFVEAYIEKPRQRLETFRAMPEFETISATIRQGTRFGGGIDEIFAFYFNLVTKLKPPTSVIFTHGDLCFSNILFSRFPRMIKFIDPRGTITADGIYGDRHYDIAKLSHSILGEYDLINNGLFQVYFDAAMKVRLYTPPDYSRSECQRVFKEYLDREGYDLTTLRLQEASLFLSMLPLHIDQPLKVLGFALKAIEILNSHRES